MGPPKHRLLSVAFDNVFGPLVAGTASAECSSSVNRVGSLLLALDESNANGECRSEHQFFQASRVPMKPG
jgi:hypothetical protein